MVDVSQFALAKVRLGAGVLPEAFRTAVERVARTTSVVLWEASDRTPWLARTSYIGDIDGLERRLRRGLATSWRLGCASSHCPRVREAPADTWARATEPWLGTYPQLPGDPPCPPIDVWDS